MDRTTAEHGQLDAIHERVSLLRSFLNTRSLPGRFQPASEWLAFLAEMKSIVGNASNDLSYIACLLAKEYLSARFEMRTFAVALKPQGASGFGIDAETLANRRIIGEIKTTALHHSTDFGAQQRQGFKKDIAKLARSSADFRFFFVTDPRAYAVVHQRHLSLLNGGGIEVVLLPNQGHPLG